MDKQQIITEIAAYKGYIPSQLRHDGEKLILYLKKGIADPSSKVKIFFHGFLSFHDTGFIGTTLSYFDIGVLGFMNLHLARKKNLPEEDYCQAVFITELENGKVELLIACKEIEVVKDL